MVETAIRETAAPWYLRQAEFDGHMIVLIDDEACRNHARPVARYCVSWADLPLEDCELCEYTHIMVGGEDVLDTFSLADALAAYADLERRLLAGELQ